MLPARCVLVARERNILIKRITIFAATALLALSMAVPAFAASPSQTQCEDAGGTFNRSGGEVTCTFVTTEPGKNKNFSETTTTTEKSKGNLDNEPQQEEVPPTTECQGTGSGKCPPGQFS